MKSKPPITTAVISSEPDAGEQLTGVLEGWESARVTCHHYQTLHEAIQSPALSSVDALFVDDRSLGESTPAELLQLRGPFKPACFLVTGEQGLRALRRALAVGARDYLHREALTEESIDRCLWGVIRAKGEAEERQLYGMALLAPGPCRVAPG